MEFWFIYVFIFLVIAASANQRKQRRKKLKPVVILEQDDFLSITIKYDSKTIIFIHTKGMFGRYSYIVEGDDYYYRTFSNTELSFPKEIYMLQAKSIYF